MAWCHGQNERPPPSYIASIRSSSTSSSQNDHNRIAIARHDAGFVQPWLGLQSRLFLNIFTPALASILFVGVGVISSKSDANRRANETKDQLMSACKSTQKAASVLASMPYYFAQNINEQTADAIESTVHGLARVLSLAMTAMEKILIFMVNMYKSLFLCFIQLLVRGSLALLISAVDALSGAVNDTARAISTSIQGSINAINASLRASLGSLNDFAKIFNKSFTVPQVPMPNLSALQNIQLPNEIDGGLRKLNNSLPTLNDLKEKIDDLIETPFEKMKSEVNSTLAKYQFDRSVLPVPNQTKLSYCQDSMDLTPIDKLAGSIHHAANVGVGILVLLAFLVIASYVTWQWFEYRSLRRHVDRSIIAFRAAHYGDKAITPTDDHTNSQFKMMSFLQLSQHAFLGSILLPRIHWIGIRTTDGINRFRWWLAWISHPVSLALLAMGFTGLIGVLIQMAAIKLAENQIKGEALAMLDENAAKLQEAVNDHLQTISNDFARRSNAVILDAQSQLNDGLLDWVETTTSTMNSTLNEFMDGIANVVNVTFANTPLFTPVQSFIGCIIGQKVAGIEKALTWIHDNSHVTFPLVNDTMLMLSNSTVQEALQPAQNDFTSSDDSDPGLLQSIADAYLDHLRKQRTMFLVLLLIYFILLMIGTIFAIFHGRKGIRSKKNENAYDFMDEMNKHANINRNENPTPAEPRTAVPISQFNEQPDQQSTSFASIGINRGHQSISRPLLPDVVSLHSQREVMNERERYDKFIKSYAKASTASSSNVRTIPSYPIEILSGSEHSINSSKITCTDQRPSGRFTFDQSRHEKHGSVMAGVGYKGVPRILSEEEKSRTTSFHNFSAAKLTQRSPTFPSDSSATFDTYVNSISQDGKGAIIFDGNSHRPRVTFGIHDDGIIQDAPLQRQTKGSESNGAGVAF